MVQFPPFWHRSRRWLVRLTPSNIQLEGCSRGMNPLNHQADHTLPRVEKGTQSDEELGSESRDRCVAGTISPSSDT